MGKPSTCSHHWLTSIRERHRRRFLDQALLVIVLKEHELDSVGSKSGSKNIPRTRKDVEDMFLELGHHMLPNVERNNPFDGMLRIIGDDAHVVVQHPQAASQVLRWWRWPSLASAQGLYLRIRWVDGRSGKLSYKAWIHRGLGTPKPGATSRWPFTFDHCLDWDISTSAISDWSSGIVRTLLDRDKPPFHSTDERDGILSSCCSAGTIVCGAHVIALQRLCTCRKTSCRIYSVWTVDDNKEAWATWMFCKRPPFEALCDSFQWGKLPRMSP